MRGLEIIEKLESHMEHFLAHNVALGFSSFPECRIYEVAVQIAGGSGAYADALCSLGYGWMYQFDDLVG